MITGLTVLNVSGKVDSAQALGRQRFPRLNINIDKVEGSGERINVGFSFVADYMDGDAKDAKKVAQIKLDGTVEVTDTKENAKAMLAKWEKEHMLPVEVAEELINGLNFRCSSAGTLVAYSLGLIPPMVISTTKIQGAAAPGASQGSSSTKR